MAIDPGIILQGRPANIDVQKSFNNALLNIQAREGLQQQREQAPLNNRLLQAEAEQAETNLERSKRESKFQSIVFGAQEISGDLAAGNFDSAMSTLLNRKMQLTQQGMPTETTDNAIMLLQKDPQQLIAKTQEVLDVGIQQGIIKPQQQGTASQRDFAQFQQMSQAAQASGDPQAIQAAQQFGLTIGVGRPTAAQKADIAVDRAAREARARADVETSTAGRIEGEKAAGRAAIKRSEDAFDRVGKIRTNVNNLDEITRLIDEGASTGVIASKLPSVRSASVALDNLQGRLGLDVIGETTFGALSESELAFALNTALPKNLSGEDLKRWVQRKKDSQLKLSGYLEEVAQFLGTPGNKTADFIELQKLKQLDQEQGVIAPALGVGTGSEQVPIGVAPAGGAGTRIKFDAQGNIIQ